MSKKLLIADDELNITSLINDYFSLIGYEVYTANDGMEVLEKLSIKPDIIILDINMPKMNGFDVCQEIRNTVDCPIIFLTARDNEHDLIHGLRIGGDDYITKPFNLRELNARIESHLRREERSTEKSNMLNRGLSIRADEMVISYNGITIPFTKTEFKIIELLSRHKGQIFNRERIYEHVKGLDSNKDNTVVTEHIRKIREKFENASCGPCIETVWGVGYKWIK